MGWVRLARQLRQGRYDCVYDLQNSDRTGLYLRLLDARPGRVISSTSRAANRRWSHPDRFSLSIAERQNSQLALAGVITPAAAPLPDVSWVAGDLPEAVSSRLADASDLALLVPGASSHRSVKRWSAPDFGHLAAALLENGLRPVVLGTAIEAEAAACIRSLCPGAVDLTGQTGFADLVRLGRRARLAVGGDTGPLHLIAASGAPSVALISGQTNPSCLPRGPRVVILKREDLSTLSLEDVRAESLALALSPRS
nr:glycosyltransferase family 9 protein [Phaeovibrio sulfidiphilus]